MEEFNPSGSPSLPGIKIQSPLMKALWGYSGTKSSVKRRLLMLRALMGESESWFFILVEGLFRYSCKKKTLDDREARILLS